MAVAYKIIVQKSWAAPKESAITKYVQKVISNMPLIQLQAWGAVCDELGTLTSDLNQIIDSAERGYERYRSKRERSQ